MTEFHRVGESIPRSYVRARTAQAGVFVPYRNGVRVFFIFSLLRAAHGPSLPLEALIPLLRSASWILHKVSKREFEKHLENFELQHR